MRNTYAKILAIFSLFVCIISLALLPTSYQASTYTSFQAVERNSETGYEIYLDDWADLLSPQEELQLLETMRSITDYGHVAFVSIGDNPTYSTDAYAKDYYYDHFSYESGTVFIIDMEERMIWLETGGNLKSTISKSYALTITDNVYRYASNGDYLGCAVSAFEQELSLLEGSKIAQPMKYISNALLAIVIALLLNYFLVMLMSRSRKASDRQIINGIYAKAEVLNPTAELVNQTKRYSPQSSGSSGARSGGRIGGGFRGGGRSIGGGHRF